MLVILLLILLLLYRLFRIPERKSRINLFILLVVSLFLNIFSLVILQLEIADLGKLGTIGSDTLEYYLQAVSLLDHPDEFFTALQKFAGGYTIFCYLILQTSFIHSPLLIVIGNILLFLNIIIQLFCLLDQAELSPQVKFISLLLIILNGHIIWTTINILKDILLLFLVLEVLLSVNTYFTKKNLLIWIKIFIILVFAHYVRLYIEYVLILTILLFFYYKHLRTTEYYRKNIHRIRRYLILVIAFGLVFYFINYNLINTKIYWYMHMAEENARKALQIYGSESAYLFNLPVYQKLSLGYLRFLLLPIPSKIWFADYFTTWKILGFIGSTIWWLLGIYFFVSLLSYFSKFTDPINTLKPLLVFVFILITIYVIIYAGTAASRLRVPMYIIGTIFGVYTIERLNIRNSVFLALLSFFVYIVINTIPVLTRFIL